MNTALETLSFLPQKQLCEKDLSSKFLEKGILTFQEAVYYIWQLPYGRNSDRSDFHLPLKENRGACSTKHALLAELAHECELEASLVLVICRTHPSKESSISPLLSQLKMDYFPEAHTYLSIEGRELDITFPDKTPYPDSDIIEKFIITSNQIGEYKVNLHKSFLKKWIQENKIELPFDHVWDLREKWILSLNNQKD